MNQKKERTQMSNVPAFKPNFKYTNIGQLVGKMVYMQPMKKKDTDEVFGFDYLIHAQGFGSINVRVPKPEVYNQINDTYTPNEKPRVKVSMIKLGQYQNNHQNIVTNATSFNMFDEPKDVTGAEVVDGIKGRVGGEVYHMGTDNEGNYIIFVAVYPTKSDGSLLLKQDKTPYEAELLRLFIVDDEMKKKAHEIKLGDNITFGYYYINKDDIVYDDFGFPTEGSSGKKIERIEIKKIVFESSQAQQPSGFGGQPAQTQPQNQNQQPANQNANPFAGQGTEQGPNSQDAQNANTAFGQQPNQNPFGSQPNQNPFGQ
jgi:hypothetical protein